MRPGLSRADCANLFPDPRNRDHAVARNQPGVTGAIETGQRCKSRLLFTPHRSDLPAPHCSRPSISFLSRAMFSLPAKNLKLQVSVLSQNCSSTAGGGTEQSFLPSPKCRACTGAISQPTEAPSLSTHFTSREEPRLLAVRFHQLYQWNRE